jgi:uncharacterized surface protein with fasciclin (FAS1) repeats
VTRPGNSSGCPRILNYEEIAMSNQEQTTVDVGTGVDASLETATVFDTARQMTEISRFVEAIENAGLDAELRGPDLRTLFAPTNEALTAAPQNFWTELQKPDEKDRLAQVIGLHIVQGKQTEADLRTTSTVKTLDGEPVQVEFRAEGSRYGGANIVRRDIACINGTIHVIDRLIVREYPYAG